MILQVFAYLGRGDQPSVECCTVGIGSVQALDLLESMGDDLKV